MLILLWFCRGRASLVATNNYYVPLPIFSRKQLVDLLGQVQCNGMPAHGVEYIIGYGSPLPLYTAWTVAYSSASMKAKYFAGTSYFSETLLIKQLIDFGTTIGGPDLTWKALYPDAVAMPLAALALSPGALGWAPMSVASTPHRS